MPMFSILSVENAEIAMEASWSSGTTERETRLQTLEAIEAIKLLKAHYLSACDRKQTEVIRGCFIDSPVYIDFGAVGRFEHRENTVTSTVVTRLGEGIRLR